MQLLHEKTNEFDYKAVENSLIQESTFITELCSIIQYPERNKDDSNSENKLNIKKHVLNGHGTSRATSIAELQERLNKVKGKPKLSYKERLAKKGIVNRMKKKSNLGKKAEHKLLRIEKMNVVKSEDKNGVVKSTKSLMNGEGNIVYSKFDLTGLGKTRKEKKQVKDPKKILENLKQQKEKIQQLEAEGEVKKAMEIKETIAWKNALAKAEGEKVKDDADLLKKTIKKKELQGKKSKKKWAERIENVKKSKDERQKKRTENIEKRKKEKKTKKVKKAVKKGRIVAGF